MIVTYKKIAPLRKTKTENTQNMAFGFQGWSSALQRGWRQFEPTISHLVYVVTCDRE